MLNLEAAHALDILPKKYNFIVIGTGGNGGHLLPNLCRLVKSVPHIQCSIIVADADVVETKNVGRQNFIAADVGKNKAAVMAERYGAAFGISIAYVDRYIEDVKTISELSRTSYNVESKVPFVIGCVDNNKTRQVIHDWFRNTLNAAWLDVGNNEFIGQAVLGYNVVSRMKNAAPEKPYPFYCPPVTERYPDIVTDHNAKFNSELSCDEMAVSAPQSIMTNIMAASCVMMMITPLLTTEKGLSFTEVAFNTKTGMITPKPNISSVIRAA